MTSVATAASILKGLKPLGTAGYKKIMMNHGAKEPVYGVKIAELQKIRKRIKRDYQLALDLYDTGNYDAMYLAGLIADDAKMSKRDLQRWAKGANCAALAASTVAWVAAEGRFGYELALKWIDAKEELVAVAGWSTLSCVMALQPDAGLDLPRLKLLLGRVQRDIHGERNQVRSAMNSFLIAVGCHVEPLSGDAVRIAAKIGEVTIDMGNTACKVPYAVDYINKVAVLGKVGNKRKTVKC